MLDASEYGDDALAKWEPDFRVRPRNPDDTVSAGDTASQGAQQDPFERIRELESENMVLKQENRVAVDFARFIVTNRFKDDPNCVALADLFDILGMPQPSTIRDWTEKCQENRCTELLNQISKAQHRLANTRKEELKTEARVRDMNVEIQELHVQIKNLGISISSMQYHQNTFQNGSTQHNITYNNHFQPGRCHC